MSIGMTRRMSGGAVLSAAVIISAIATQAQAVNVAFFEDFEGYPAASFSGGTNSGLPQVSEGANETWFGGRFESPDDGSINNDIVVRRNPSIFPEQVNYARFEDDGGIIFKLSTLGIADPVLTFDWKTSSTGSTDDFVAGYYIGDVDFASGTPDGALDNMVRRFHTDGPQWETSWTELLRDRHENGWDNDSFSLPGNQPTILVAFWLDGGEGDHGKVDNIVVTPEPGSAILLAAGLGLAVVRRRRNAA